MLQTVEFRILACFWWQNSRRFAELCRAVDLPTDLGGYYIRRLVKAGYLLHSERGIYTLSSNGKQQLAISYDNKPYINRPRLCVMVIAQQENKFVILQRTQQPFIGVAEWPASAITYGETISTATERLLSERLGVTDSSTPAGAFRRIDMYQDTVFDDKLFLLQKLVIHRNVRLHEKCETGNNILLDRAELLQLQNPSKSLLDILSYVAEDRKELHECVYHLQKSDIFLD